MPASRPYFKLSIADLEALHGATPADTKLSARLLEELRHRSTDRAAALMRKLERSLAVAQTAAVAAGRESPAGSSVASVAAAPTAISLAGHPPPLKIQPGRTTPSPQRKNEPASILASWVAMEALSPQTYRRPEDLANGDRRCVAPLASGELPWERGEKSRPNYQLYYQVVLGAIPMDRATEALIKTFGDSEERTTREGEQAAIAAILVDREGRLLKDRAVAVSSFAWALPIAMRGDLTSLSTWPTAEDALVRGLTECLGATSRDGESAPLNLAGISKAFRWLVTSLGLPDGLYKPPTFALRVFHHLKAKSPPEVALLNSFFLSDLVRASRLVREGRPGKALARFIGVEEGRRSEDLLSAPSLLEWLLAPQRMPVARWPAPGGHPLVALQQAAVNAARAEVGSPAGGIASVNGPPGTGKTTLLRDIVAACVTDRAIAMAEFEDPLAAFTPSGLKVPAGNGFYQLYRLAESLKGHEVLIASSNNKAVENVSKELPSSKAVGRQLAYFRTTAQRLAEQRAVEGDASGTDDGSWGLIAAVLGNAGNRYAFQQAFWFDDDCSFRVYLKAAKGEAVVREIKDDSGMLRREIPTVVAAEEPPTPEEAKARWKRARQTFSNLHDRLKAELRRLEGIRSICLELKPARQAQAQARSERDALQTERTACEREVAVCAERVEAAKHVAKKHTLLERQARAEQPAWWGRLLRTGRFRRWQVVYSPILADKAAAESALAQAAANGAAVQSRLNALTLKLQSANERVATTTSAVARIEAVIEQHRRTLGGRLVDDGFFAQGHAGWNLASPWLPDEVHRQREDLFSAALALHRAFIDVAAQKFSHNLGALMGAMQSGAFQDDAKRELLGDLWSTLFLVVPAVSTTFASVDRMLGDLAPQSVGWLLIDEAGQATPQSAVGALLRVKRAVVVGDPLQIPPVVSLPERLVVQISKYFNVSDEKWAAPTASVQTVADEASHFQAEFRADAGVRRVGLPLLVHRRCREPMFGISNRIAYDGQMVHAVVSNTLGPIAAALGASAWLDVDGQATSKWCGVEGEVVVRLLRQLAAAGVRQPDLYVITPFRIVANEMRRRLESEAGLFRQFDVALDDWLKERVGTIHTFQGKEAEAVIAVLGAPAASQHGARRWACATPNILNVMVSRAKQRVYVIGSLSAWGGVGHCRTVAQALPVHKPS